MNITVCAPYFILGVFNVFFILFNFSYPVSSYSSFSSLKKNVVMILLNKIWIW